MERRLLPKLKQAMEQMWKQRLSQNLKKTLRSMSRQSPLDPVLLYTSDKSNVSFAGPGADSDTTTVVKSDKDIDVSRYVARVSNGEEVITVANELVIELGKSSAPFVVSTFKTGLAEQEKKGELYFKTLELYVQKQGCDAIKAVFKNEELNFLPFKLPEVFYKCIYYSCSGYGSAASCCGAAQLKQSQCSCKDGKCLWKQPTTQGVYLKYWNCDDCGETIPYCVCY